MAEQKSNKPYFADVFNAVYLFHKKWNGTGYGDADWEQIMHEATQLRNKVASSENHPLYTYCTDVLMSALAEIERHNGANGTYKSVADYHLHQMMHALGTTDKSKIIDLIKRSEGKG